MFRNLKSRQRRSQGTGVQMSMKVDADEEIVWRIILDVEAHPKTYRTCVGVENLNPKKSLSPVQAGAKYMDKRVFEGEQHEIICSVTVVDPIKRLYSEATTIYGCTGTFSTCIKDVHPGHCTVSASYGIVPDGWYGKLFLWTQGKRMEREGRETLLWALEDLKYAAETGKYINDSKLVTDSSTSSSNRVDLGGKAPR